MLKINYPKSSKEISFFHKRFLNCFSERTEMQKKLDVILSKKELRNDKRFKIDYILTASIEQLFKLSKFFNKWTKKETEILKRLFNYDNTRFGKKHQPIIADFFMNSPELNITTCYFCNIDHIYTFNFINDFKSGLDLVKRGKEEDIMRIKGIGKAFAAKITKQKKNIKSLSSLDIPAKLIDNLYHLNAKEKNNLFTLDHVLDKATYPYAALSLYNFVPCCYGCNSKFKGSEPLIRMNANISPTSKGFTFSKWVKFKLFFPLEFGKTYRDIKTTKDFVLDFKINKNNDDFENYLKVFKLRPRYVFHKREVLDLIELRKAYSESQINEIAKIAKRTALEVKKNIFGLELFENEAESKSLTKLRRDIAIDIGIKDVIR
jgi:hypothetical protein